jgi:hypothetical protein
MAWLGQKLVAKHLVFGANFSAYEGGSRTDINREALGFKPPDTATITGQDLEALIIGKAD